MGHLLFDLDQNFLANQSTLRSYFAFLHKYSGNSYLFCIHKISIAIDIDE
jgi:hypothetical protein